VDVGLNLLGSAHALYQLPRREQVDVLAYREVLLARGEDLRFQLLGSGLNDGLELELLKAGKRSPAKGRGLARVKRQMKQGGATDAALDWWLGGD